MYVYAQPRSMDLTVHEIRWNSYVIIHPDGILFIVYIGIDTNTRISIGINIIQNPGELPPALINTSNINKRIVVCYQFITSSRINIS